MMKKTDNPDFYKVRPGVFLQPDEQAFNAYLKRSELLKTKASNVSSDLKSLEARLSRLEQLILKLVESKQ